MLKPGDFKERLLIALLGKKISEAERANSPSKTGRRIVGKGDYVKAQGVRAGYAISGASAVFLCSLSGFIALICLYGTLQSLRYALSSQGAQAFTGALMCLALGLFFGAVMVCLWRPGFASIEKARENEVVPLTRANTGDLPANDTLVRASSEPMQVQETVLLRAAATGQETREEQLLRASARGQE